MSEKPTIVPNPEVVVEEEIPEQKPKFPTKLVRNVLIGAAGVAITGYVVSKIRSKDDCEEETSTIPWQDFVPAAQTESAAE